MVKGWMRGSWLLSRLGEGHFANDGGWSEGFFIGPVVRLLRERRDFVGRRR
jgi:hypothetical protein